METILIVEDEASVRTTLQEWLQAGHFDVEVLTAADAAAALQLASKQTIDLAILDWNLGAGLNGLQLLEDLHEFQPDVVAILVTGYAHKATPLDALRLGVRDYLDKTHDLSRERFLTSVGKQLERIRPVKRERLIQVRLERFRSVVTEALPRLETANVLQNEGAKLDDSAAAILHHAQKFTEASAGLLVFRQFNVHHPESEQLLVFDHLGRRQSPHEGIRYSHSLAAAISGLAPDCLSAPLASARENISVELSPSETPHLHVLGMSLYNSQSMTVVVELFDKKVGNRPSAFTAQDKLLLQSFQPLAWALLALSAGERASQKMLYDTLKAALEESTQFVGTLSAAKQGEATARELFIKHVGQAGAVDSPLIGTWAEYLHRLSSRYGPSSVGRIMNMLEQVELLLADITGTSQP